VVHTRRSADWLGSRYVGRRFRLASVDGLRDLLRRLGEEPSTRGAVLLPTSEEFLAAVLRDHDTLAARFVPATPSPARAAAALDLAASLDLARAAGVAVPGFIQPADEAELDQALPALAGSGRRYLLRARHFIEGGLDAWGRRRTRLLPTDAAGIRAAWRDARRRIATPPLIVELVPGSLEACVGVILAVGPGGAPLGGFCVRRLAMDVYAEGDVGAHPYVMGGNAFCETAHDPEAYAIADRLARAMGLAGAVTIELKRHAATGELHLIKADLQWARAMALSGPAGVDVPLAVFRAFTGQPVDLPSGYPDGVGWCWGAAYGVGLLRGRRRRPMARELAALWRRRRQIGAWAYWDRRDPLPFLLYGLEVARQLRPDRLREWLAPAAGG
jgi:hypothetical protein